MATGTCEFCGREEYMPFVCKFCKGRYCAEHRLPENHACRGLDMYRERVRETGRIVMPEGGVVAPKVSAGARFGMGLNSLFARAEGKISYWILGAMAACSIPAMFLYSLGYEDAVDTLFLLDRTFYLEPWTVLTSVFAHVELFPHFFFNALIFFMFAPSLERLIGSKRLLGLFVGGGVVAGLLQLLVFQFWLPTTGIFDPATSDALANAKILGASGGIMALFGTLTFLAPRLPILVFFFLPAPLWLVTSLYALFDVLGFLTPGSSVAHLAHLAGLAIGLGYGKRLKDQGLSVRVATPAPPAFRRF